ncbi:MAG: hypothetical protein EBZ24_14055, partial [Synechococcaceae bacterium WB9_4xB_025]|nr:hypothetical protein [Synechococcaceae bacterium WB9_4xB_025]
DTRAAGLDDFFYVDTRGVLPFAQWVEGDPADLWSFDTAEDGYDPGFAEALLRLDAGLDRLQRPDRFKLNGGTLRPGWISESDDEISFSLGDPNNPLAQIRVFSEGNERPSSLLLELDPVEDSSHMFVRADGTTLTDSVSLALSLDSSDSENPFYKATLPSGLQLKVGESLEAVDLRVTALVELPDARALLGLEAALAFELFHPELTEAGDQGLVPVQDVEAAGFAAGALSFDLDQLLSFITAGNPLGSTADAIADALNAVTNAVDEALCGLDEGALTPANWLAMLTGLADRIEDLRDALVGNLGSDPLISGVAEAIGIDFDDIGAGFTTVADTVRSFTDAILPPDEWCLRFNQAMDQAGLGDISLSLVEKASPDAFAGECPEHDPAVRTPLLYLFELDFGDGLDWSIGGD